MFSVEVFADITGDEIGYYATVHGGTAHVNDATFYLNNYDIDEIPNRTKYICFSAEYKQSSESFENGGIDIYDTMPSDTASKKYALIATINGNDGMVTVNQNQFGAIRLLFFGDCGEEGDEND